MDVELDSDSGSFSSLSLVADADVDVNTDAVDPGSFVVHFLVFGFFGKFTFFFFFDDCFNVDSCLRAISFDLNFNDFG